MLTRLLPQKVVPALWWMVLVVLPGLFLLAGCDGAEKKDVFETGSSLPALEIMDRSGTQVSTASWRGRVLILNVWATWCGPCREEMPSLQWLQRQLDGERFQLVGLSVDDDPLLVEEFLLQENIDFSIVRAVNRRTVEDKLGIRGYPETLIFSPVGKLLDRISGGQDWRDKNLLERVMAAGS